MASKTKGTGDVVTDDKTVLLPEVASDAPFFSHGVMDQHEPGPPVLHVEERRGGFTAKEYRDKGYNISDKYADDDVVYQVEADGYGNPHDVILADGSVYGSEPAEQVVAAAPEAAPVVPAPAVAKAEPAAPATPVTDPKPAS